MKGSIEVLSVSNTIDCPVTFTSNILDSSDSDFKEISNIPVLNERIEKKIFQERYDKLKKICNALLNGLGFLNKTYGVITNLGFQKTIMHALSGAEGYLCNKTLKTLNSYLNLAEISETYFTRGYTYTIEGNLGKTIRVEAS